MRTAYSYVRFSSKPQEQGDSVRRQLKLARDYAAKHSLVLDERSYADLGVSAFKGKNVVDGALGTFLKAVEQKKVKQGSYLLVESLDRVSRLEVMEALQTFLTIVNSGIVLVTLSDGQQYTRTTINENWTKLIMALAVMARANEESAMKAKRVKAAWESKAESGKIMTAMGPAWLKLNDDRTEWIVLPEKVALVHKVFEFALEGHGGPTIARKLNDLGVPVMQSAKMWEVGVIMAMLRNQAVIGRLDRKKANADPIDDYYPPILSKDKFYKVQEMITNRRKFGAGQKGTNVANLFSGLIRCECGNRIRYVSGAKPHLYVRCLSAYSNQGCEAPPFPYGKIETFLMQYLLNFEGVDLKLGTDVNEDRKILLEAELGEKQLQVQNLVDVFVAGKETAARLAPLVNKMAALEADVVRLQEEIRHFVPATPAGDALKAARELYKRHKKLVKSASPEEDSEELRALRLELQAALKPLFSQIVLNKQITERNGHEFAQMVVYGEVAGIARKSELFWTHEHGYAESNPELSRPDGGFVIEYTMPEWGLNGTRRRTKRA